MKKSGFTIIELLVSISIISLLVAAVSLNVSTSQANTRDARRISDITQIAKVIDASQFINRGAYPKFTTANSSGIGCVSDIATDGLDFTAFPNNRIPKDPRPASPSTTCTSLLNGYTYKTSSSTTATEKKLFYALEFGLERKISADTASLEKLTEQSSRTGYMLAGPYCGSTCPQP